MRIAVKYCGTCNPEIDLPQVGKLVASLVQEQGWQLVGPGGDQAYADVLVLLCGCPRACVDTPELRRQANHVVVVAGRQVGWQLAREEDIPGRVIEAVRELAAKEPGKAA